MAYIASQAGYISLLSKLSLSNTNFSDLHLLPPSGAPVAWHRVVTAASLALRLHSGKGSGGAMFCGRTEKHSSPELLGFRRRDQPHPDQALFPGPLMLLLLLSPSCCLEPVGGMVPQLFHMSFLLSRQLSPPKPIHPSGLSFTVSTLGKAFSDPKGGSTQHH